MIKETLFKQTWWVSLAVVLAVLQIVFAVANGGDQDASATERLVFFFALGGSAALAFIGVQQRPRNRRIGDALIALGVVPAVVSGIIFFWFPPMWLTTAAGLVVMVFSIRDAMNPVGATNTT
jgi:peptidoglycan/LPS O-acetylase OafA/YrhL